MRKTIALLGVLSLWMTATPGAYAKTLKFSRGGAHVDQLHDELLSAFPAWKGTQQPDGSYERPLLSVESTPAEILLTVPDEAPEAAVRQVVAAHVPKDPQVLSPRESAQNKLGRLGFTKEEI
ncbi:MAG: hypothetical protein HY211_03475, partial [Candidatus Omnitrophica bacterium]|nr:hypothetical protein [Candidatus Omnitrophota bacterium]